MDVVQSRLVSILKSILIFALAALAVFQVSQLWFVNLTDRTFFLYVQARFAPRAPDGHGDFVIPFRVVYGAGDGYFNIRHSDMRNLRSWNYTSLSMGELLSNGNFVGRTVIDRDAILTTPMFMFEYTFNMCPDIFSIAFDQRSGGALTGQGIEYFNRFAVLPPASDSESLTVFFMTDDYKWEFNLPAGRVPSISIEGVAQEFLHFVPVNSDAIGFVPVQPPQFSYHPIGVTNPYQSAFGTLTLSSIRSRVEPFFNNPATINQRSGAGGIYTFSNLNTMVRYLVYDVLEYTSFRPIGTIASSELVEDFAAAFNFISNDPYVLNEFFLAGYESRGRENIFWFDYVIDDFPLVFAEPWETGPACANPLLSPIEVVVDHGRVVRYRRIVYNFHVIENLTYSFTTDVLTADLYDRGEPYMLGFTILREAILDLEVIGG